MAHNIWFSFDDDEVELQDVSMDTTIAALRRRLHESKLFKFPAGTAQTDIEIGISHGGNFEKWKPRSTLDELGILPKKDTLIVRVRKPEENESETGNGSQGKHPGSAVGAHVAVPGAPALPVGVAVSGNAGPSCPSPSVVILQGSERAIRWEYDPYATTAEWAQTAILVRIEQVPFAEGNFRKAFYCHDLSQPPSNGKFVAKIAKKACPRGVYFEDVRTQMIARKWADRYNERNPPKKVAFLMSYVLELIDRPGDLVICGAEPYVEGQYRKYNNNSGFVGNDDRNTPQAFSHFSYEHSNHQILIVDVQGVADYYTDPQIHTYDGVGFGQGNLGQQGFEKFLETHRCNAICQFLGLQSINAKSAKYDSGTIPRPELDLPDLPSSSNGAPQLSTRAPLGRSFESLEPPPYARRDIRRDEKPEEFRNGSGSAGDAAPARPSGRWDLSTIKCVETIKAHHDMVAILIVVEDQLFSGSADNLIKVWDIKTLECVSTLKGHEGAIEALCANDQHLFSGSADNTIKQWDLKRLRCIHTVDGHDKAVHILCINAQYLFSGSADKAIKVWDLKTLECKYTLDGHNFAVKALCVSGQYLFSGSNDKTIKVWDLKNFRCNYTLKGHTKWVKALGILGASLFSGSYDKTIRVWSLKSLECTSTLRGHERWVENLEITSRGLFSASDDNTIKVWDIDTYACVTTLEGHNGCVQSLAVYEPRRLLFSGSHDTTIKVWSWDEV